jgi:hypothetical protein
MPAMPPHFARRDARHEPSDALDATNATSATRATTRDAPKKHGVQARAFCVTSTGARLLSALPLRNPRHRH